MTARLCPICGGSLEEGDATFEIPRLPPRYGFEEIVGRAHRRCLLDYELRNELRSAIARSIAGAVHSPPERLLRVVDGSMLYVYDSRPQEHNVWNLADFVTFTIVDRSLDDIRSAAPGDTVAIASRPQTELEFLSSSVTRLQTHSATIPMPTLGLQRLNALFSPKRHIEAADATVRLNSVSGEELPDCDSIVGWFADMLDVEPPPVLLRAVPGIPGTYSLAGVDPHTPVAPALAGGPLRLRISPDSEVEVMPSSTRVPEGTTELHDRGPEDQQPLREPADVPV